MLTNKHTRQSILHINTSVNPLSRNRDNGVMRFLLNYLSQTGIKSEQEKQNEVTTKMEELMKLDHKTLALLVLHQKQIAEIWQTAYHELQERIIFEQKYPLLAKALDVSADLHHVPVEVTKLEKHVVPVHSQITMSPALKKTLETGRKIAKIWHA